MSMVQLSRKVPMHLASSGLLKNSLKSHSVIKSNLNATQKILFSSSTSTSTGSSSGSSGTRISTRSSSTSINPGSLGQNNGRTLLFGTLGGLAITLFGGLAYVKQEVGGTEGLSRSLSFYKMAIPSYLQYRYLMWKGDSVPDEEWDELDRVTSKKALEKILELEGFYIKNGQMAASNIGNAFPKIWVDTMSVLQDECPSKPFSVVKSTLERELGKPLNEIFASIEEKPIGAASIGQVHRATLLNGDKVVVKVMYPNVESVFRGDVRTIIMFCQVAQPVHVPALEEIEKQFMTEFDYKQEALQMNEIRENLLKGDVMTENDSTPFKVPKPYLDLCTKQVLVMEELKGHKLIDGLQQDMERHAASVGKTPEQFKAEEEELNRIAIEKRIVRKGPTAAEFDQYIALLDAKRKAKNLGNRMNNTLLAWWMPKAEWKPYEGKSTLPTNYATLVDQLFYVHGHQILVDGCFNGDPHPGNILLLRNEADDQQLGLIDYGQVKRLSDADRHLFCKLIIALDDDNKEEIVRLTKETGYKTKTMNEDVFYKVAKISYDQDNAELTDGKHIQLFLEDIQNADPVVQVAQEFVMISRVSIMLRGLAHNLQQSRSAAKLWRPIAEEVLLRETGSF